MNEELRKLFEQRKKAHEDAKRLKDEATAKAKEENRDISEDEDQSIRRALDEWSRLNKEIELEEELLEQQRAEAAAGETADDLRRSTPERDLIGASEGDQEAQERLATRAFEMFIVARGDSELQKRYASEMEIVDKAITSGELDTRALQMDSDIYGGYMVAPQAAASRFIQAVDDAFILRQFSHVEQLMGAHSLGAAALDNDPADAAWTAEIGSVSEDSTMSFGARELSPHDLTKLIKVSLKLLRHSNRPIEGLVRERLSYKIGVPLENAGMTGSGAGQPLGLFTASANGISTSRDVSTSNSTTAPTFDNMKRVKFTLKANYWPRARWIMHRDVALQYALIKDGEGRYQWQDAVRAGEPSTLGGFPVSLSEYAPNTLTTGQYVAILGDLENYWWADSMQITFTRLNELYRANRQIGFMVEAAHDGMPVLEEAFVRVKLA